MRNTTKLRQKLSQGMVSAAGCYDAFSARMAELAGFEAIHMTGLGVEATQLCALFNALGHGGTDFSGIIKFLRGDIS